MDWLKINKQLLPIKAFYFLWNAGMAILPYLAVFARQLNVSSKEVGIINTIVPIFSLILKPLTGVLTDKYKCQKFVFLIAHVIAMLSICMIIFLPQESKPLKQQHVNFRCADLNGEIQMCNYDLKNMGIESCDDVKKINSVAYKYCDFKYTYYTLFNFTNFKEVSCHQINTRNLSKFVDLISKKCAVGNRTLQCSTTCFEKEAKSFSGSHNFLVLFGASLTLIFACDCTTIISDTVCFQLLDKAPHKYGHQRLFGSLGFGVVSSFIGYIIDKLSANQTNSKNYIIAFWLGIVILSLCAITSCFIKCSQVQKTTYKLKEIKNIFGNSRAIIFLAWCTFLGMFFGFDRCYLLFFVDDLAVIQGPNSVTKIKTIQGIAMATRTLAGEVPFFFVSGLILKRVNLITVMSCTLLIIGVRLITCSFLLEPWLIVPLEVLQGWIYGAFYSTMVAYANSISTTDTNTTAQGVVGAFYGGAGNAIGALAGGYLYDDFGGAQTFRIFGMVALTCCFLHVTMQYFIERYETKELSITFEEKFTPTKELN